MVTARAQPFYHAIYTHLASLAGEQVTAKYCSATKEKKVIRLAKFSLDVVPEGTPAAP